MLREGQKDSDSLRDYDLMDPILYGINGGGKTIEQLRSEGYDKKLLDKVESLTKSASFKVAQIPPIFNLSCKPIGYKEKWLL